VDPSRPACQPEAIRCVGLLRGVVTKLVLGPRSELR
jgi:hypothetical protein